MDEEQEKAIINEIREFRRLPYSIELISAEGDVYTVRNNWGNEIVYIKRDEKYLLKEELEE